MVIKSLCADSYFATEVAEPDDVGVEHEHEAHGGDDAHSIDHCTHHGHEQGTADDACVNDTRSCLRVRAKFLQTEVEDERPHHRVEQTGGQHEPDTHHRS